jgi:hypothetical protein
MSGSQRNDGRRVAVREASVRDALMGHATELESEEERVIRVLHGVGGRPDLPLQAKASGATLEALRRMEVELLRRYRTHLDRPRPQASEAKDRIVRALRRKR